MLTPMDSAEHPGLCGLEVKIPFKEGGVYEQIAFGGPDARRGLGDYLRGKPQTSHLAEIAIRGLHTLPNEFAAFIQPSTGEAILYARVGAL